jgi:ankyrin repeat protein
LLLEKGADVNKKERSGKTALLIAAENGHKQIVELLLGKGADAYKRCEYRDDLILAAEHGHKDIVELLLAKGAPVYKNDKFGNAALTLAAKNGHKEIVKLLLERGAPVNEGKTPALPSAAERGYKEIVELLLAKGADVNKMWEENGEFYTALILAAGRGYKEIVELLLAKGADVNAVIYYNHYYRHGFDPILGKEDGDSALIVAVKHGHKEIVELLLAKGAWVEYRLAPVSGTSFFKSALQAAAGNIEIVGLLKKYDLDCGKPRRGLGPPF